METIANQIQRTVPMLALRVSPDLQGKTNSCLVRKCGSNYRGLQWYKEGGRSVPEHTWPLRGGNHSHVCVVRNAVPLKSFCFNGIRHKGREVVITRAVAMLPEQFSLSYCSCSSHRSRDRRNISGSRVTACCAGVGGCGTISIWQVTQDLRCAP